MAEIPKTQQEIQLEKFKTFIKSAVTRGMYKFKVDGYEALANGSFLAKGTVSIPSEADPKKLEAMDMYWRIDGGAMKRLTSQPANDGFNKLDLIQLLSA